MQGADSVDIAASMVAAKDVGGDFYDFFPIDDEHFGFTIADVSGKGVPAAIFMAVSRTIIKTTGIGGAASHECMQISNEMLCSESINCMFVTVFYGICNIKTGEIDYTNAGHNAPYILHADGQVEMLKSDVNLVLGIAEGIPYKSNHMRLEPGDSLVMYTDGVTEAENGSQELYGEERLEAALKTLRDQTSQQIVDAINKGVKDFAGDAPQSDDITQLVIRRLK